MYSTKLVPAGQSRMLFCVFCLALSIVFVFMFGTVEPVQAQAETPPAPTEITELAEEAESPETPVSPDETEVTLPSGGTSEEPDEIAPQETPGPAVSTEVTGEEEVTETPPADAPVTGEEQAGDPPAEPEQTADPEAAAGELASQLSENDLVVVDENGEAIPMASEAGQEILTAPDPWFVVRGKKISFTAADCDPISDGNQPCTTPIQAALDYIKANKITIDDGIIHVDAGVYTENIELNGFEDEFNYQGFVKGIWGAGTAVNSSGTCDPGTSCTQINGSIHITQTFLGFSLQGLVVNGPVVIEANGGTLKLTDLKITNPNGNGLDINSHYGAVVLDQVDSSGNKKCGALIDNMAVKSPVSVTNSSFTHNQGILEGGETWKAGLVIWSNGLITVNGVNASYNNGDGFDANPVAGMVVKNSIFNNNFAEPDNMNYGLGIWTPPNAKGNFTFENVIVKNNESDGILAKTSGKIILSNSDISNNARHGLVSCTGDECKEAGNAGFTVSNSVLNKNGGSGLLVVSKGNFVMTSSTVNENMQSGAYLWGGVYIDTCIPDAITGKCTAAGTVSITSSTIQANKNGDGLYVRAKGQITLKDTNVNESGDNGAVLDNSFPGATAGVTISSSKNHYSEFTNNNGFGLTIFSNGSVSVSAASLYWNYGEGVYINNAQPGRSGSVTLKDVDIYGSKYQGLRIKSYGQISLSNVSVGNSSELVTDGGGAYLNNEEGPAARNVTITDSSFYENHNGSGLAVLSKGTVTLKNVSAYGNMKGCGVNIDNDNGTAGVTIQNSYIYSFRENDQDGINVLTKGTVTLKNIYASQNGGMGVTVNNSGGTKAQPVSLTGVTANDNGLTGIRIESKGSVSLTDVGAVRNGSEGLYVDNRIYDSVNNSYSGTGSVKIVTKSVNWPTGSFSNNGSNGMTIRSFGSISVTVYEIHSNGGYGILLDNRFAGSTGSVSIGGYSKQARARIDANADTGMTVRSNGSITVNMVDVNSNGGYGAVLENMSSLSNKPVSITEGTFNGNNLTGLLVQSNGAINLKRVVADENSLRSQTINSGETWAERTNDYETDTWAFNGSAGQSARIVMTPVDSVRFYLDLLDPDGYIIASNQSDGTNNAVIEIASLPATGDYTIRISDYDGDSGRYRVSLSINGQSLSGISTLEVYGIYLDNCNLQSGVCKGKGGVTVSQDKAAQYGSSIDGNLSDGMRIETAGAVTINGIYYFEDNGGNGLAINNAYLNSPVSINNVSMYNNHAYGLIIHSRGAVTLKGIYSDYNDLDGANIDNSKAGKANPVSVSSSDFYSNENGLVVTSDGMVTLSQVWASNNRQYGAYLNNCRPNGQNCENPYLSGITITAGDFWDNQGGDGLAIFSRGNVVINNPSTSNNGGAGIYIKNDYNGAIGKVTIAGGSKSGIKSQFYNSGSTAIEIYTLGTISLSNIYVWGSGSGIMLDNAQSAAPKNVTLSNVEVTQSTYSGLMVFSKGKVSLTNITANESAGSYGIFVSTPGSITASGITANKNQIAGMYLSNLVDGASGTITLSGINTFNNNTGTGLVAESNRAISIKGITANQNSGCGLNLVSESTISITTATLRENGEDGLYLDALGAITLNSISSQLNGMITNYDGAYIHAGNNVKISNSSFTGNGGNGIEVWLASGVLSLVNTSYFGNDMNGDAAYDVNLNKH